MERRRDREQAARIELSTQNSSHLPGNLLCSPFESAVHWTIGQCKTIATTGPVKAYRMLIAPYSTDAPIYHLPIATGVLVIANVVIFLVTTLQLMLGNVEAESIEWLILQFNTINPLQWITSAFMHGGIMHLIGNMFFLWAFGLVVEGKIGSFAFVAIYFAIAAVDGAVVQLPMFLMGSEGGALGASGVIFALMIIAVLWAPENEMDCFYFVGFYFGTFEVRIVKLAGAFLLLQILFLVLGRFSMSSEMLHIIGAAIGLPIGVGMLRKNLVDCEGWDIISRNEWLREFDWLCTPEQRRQLQQKEDTNYDPVRAALATSAAAPSTRNAAAMSASLENRKGIPQTKPDSTRTTTAKRGLFSGKKTPTLPVETKPPDFSAHPDFSRLVFLLRQAIASKSTQLAQQHFVRLAALDLARGVSDEVLLAYVGLLAQEKRYTDTLLALNLVADRGGDKSNPARIRIAQIQLHINHDPRAAAKILASVQVAANQMTAENQKIIAMRDSLLAKTTG